MTNGARLFAYTTWVLMISLAIIIFTDSFLVYVNDPGWVGLAALLAYGFIYLNFSYLSIKRFVRKVSDDTMLHFVLAFLIYLPPAVWVAFVSENSEGITFIMLIVLAFSTLLGALYGYRAAKRDQMEDSERVYSES
jgi:hypothetical protein